MKKLLFAFMAMMLFACSSDDSTPANPNNGNPDPENPNPENPNPVECTNVYTGNVWLKTQAEVDAFAANGYCNIDGVLYIGEEYESPTTNITDISALSALVNVSKMIIVNNNAGLASLNGLQNIKGLKELRVTGSHALTNLEGCPNLLEGAEVHVAANENGLSLQGLELKKYMLLNLGGDIDLGYFAGYENINVLSKLSITQNKATTLSGLEHLTTIGKLELTWNSNLISLQGLENVTSLENIYFYSNAQLVSLEQLHGVTAIGTIPEITHVNVQPGFYIGGNAKLESLNGLENVLSYDGFLIFITGNDVLTDFCALSPLFQNDTDIMQWSVFTNAYNPTQQNIKAGNCSQ